MSGGSVTEQHGLDFGARCKEVMESNPVRDFARQLVEAGFDEARLVSEFSNRPELPSDFTTRLHNEFRSLKLGLL